MLHPRVRIGYWVLGKFIVVIVYNVHVQDLRANGWGLRVSLPLLIVVVKEVSLSTQLIMMTRVTRALFIKDRVMIEAIFHDGDKK